MIEYQDVQTKTRIIENKTHRNEKNGEEKQKVLPFITFDSESIQVETERQNSVPVLW